MTSPRTSNQDPQAYPSTLSSSSTHKNPSAEAGLAFADYFKTTAGPGTPTSTSPSYHHTPVPVQRPHGLAARSVSGGSATGALPLSSLLSGGGGGSSARGEEGSSYPHRLGHGLPSHRNGSIEAEERRPSIQGYSYSNLARDFERRASHATPPSMIPSGSGRQSSSERRTHYDEDPRLSYPYTRQGEMRGLSPPPLHSHHHQVPPHRSERQPSHPVRPFLTSPAESLGGYGAAHDYPRDDRYSSVRGTRYYADEQISPQANIATSSIRGHREHEYDRERSRRDSESVFGPMPTGRTEGRPLPPSSNAVYTSSAPAEYDREREYRNHSSTASHNGNASAPNANPVMLDREEMIKAKRARLSELVKWEARRRASPGTSVSNNGESGFHGYKRERARSTASPAHEHRETIGNGSMEPFRRAEDELPRMIRADSYGGLSNHYVGGMALSRPQSRTGSIQDHPPRLGSTLSDSREDYRTFSGHPNEYATQAKAMRSISPLPEPRVLPVPPLVMAAQPMSVDTEAPPDEKPFLVKRQKSKSKGRGKQPAPLLEHRELTYGDDEPAPVEPEWSAPGETDGYDMENELADGTQKSRRRNKQEQNKEMSPETKERWERESWPTKGLVNKDGSLRRKPGPPKGIPKIKKPGPRKSEAGVNGDGGDIRQQALLNASGLGEAEGSVQDDLVSEDGTPISLPAAETPPKKKAKRAKKQALSQSVSRASSPAVDLLSEADSQFAAEVDNDLEDMLGGVQVSKSKRKARDLGMFDSVPPPQYETRPYADDPFSGEDDADPLALMEMEAGIHDDPESGHPPDMGLRPESMLDPEPEMELVPDPEPEPEPVEEAPTAIPMSEFLQFDQPDAVVTERVARARYLKAELMRASIWKDIVTNQIPPVCKHMDTSLATKVENARKLCGIAVRQQKRWVQRPYSTPKEVQARARKAARDAAAYWKKNEKEEIEQRKRAEREAIEKAKADEAAREKARAAKRLQFLLDSGETYSKLMLKKIKTDDAMDSNDTAVDPNTMGPDADDDMDIDEDFDEADIEVNEDDHDPDVSDEVAKQRAAARARAIMGKKRREAAAFDKQVQAERQAAMAAKGNVDEQLTSESLDFQNPLGAGVRSTVTQPKMLQAQLKEYQVKGLSWLAHLYENGINGILADEMGLGKTIQSISLLAWLAETQNIWGPFLVVAPTSTVHNWQQELTRFVPKLKAIPYWGKPSDRQVLRRDWNRKSIVYTEDAPFHLVVTSYDMAVQDHAYFHKVRWQYMILDEAQAVKNSSSLRWTTLLSLKTRNRLLLTGTPIQNSMTELWALLHFIMPDLFTSLTDFTEWFSKGIEGVAGQGDSTLGTQQLRRLHDVLRPFMLRRIKKNVQSELGDKIEKDILVDLSSRQKAMYRMLRSDASIKAFLAQASAGSDSAAKTNVLLNIVMQFRKVCNHPDLFQRPDVISPLAFGTFSGSGELIRQKELYCPDSCRNPIEFSLPKLIWEDGGILSRPGEKSLAGFDTRYLKNLFNIWSPVNAPLPTAGWKSDRDSLFEDPEEHKLPGYYQFFKINTKQAARPAIDVLHDRSFLTRKEARFVVEDAVAPPVHMTCASRSFIVNQEQQRLSEADRLILFGLPGPLADDEVLLEKARESVPNLPPLGLIGESPTQQLPLPSMAFPNAKRLMVDSAKLLRMDLLLRELKEGGHRVLVYFQMTKMMDLFEEFLSYRQHRYVRLDGSTQLGERRDMVNAYQTNPDIFVFMLSTRAGGLGINLTAADTVIFYEHDWNPSNDSQAMDRAHRVGQTRQVTVYRLICKGTVEERMLHLARNKKDVQDIVVGNKSVAEVNSGKEIVSMLLDDEDDTGALAGGFSRGHGMATDVGNPLFGGGGDQDDDNFFGNAVKKQAVVDDAAGDKPAKAKKRKTAAVVVDEDGVEIKPKRVRKKKADVEEGGEASTVGVADGEKPKAKRKRKAKVTETETPGTGTGTGTPVEGIIADDQATDALLEEVL